MRECGVYPIHGAGYSEEEIKVGDPLQRLLIDAGVLPEFMPNNFTFNKVREVIGQLKDVAQDRLLEAVRLAKVQKISGPLATVVFIKHHLDGVHEAEVDRVMESEDGVQYAVLIYPEGELPIPVESLPDKIEEGISLHYDPIEGRYSQQS